MPTEGNQDSKKLKSRELLRYFVSDNDSLEVSYSVLADKKVNFTGIEYSFDLLSNPQFSIPNRPDYTMPTPFVVNDAIVIKKTIDINSLQIKIKDTILE
jgi:hypothetical protein